MAVASFWNSSEPSRILSCLAIVAFGVVWVGLRGVSRVGVDVVAVGRNEAWVVEGEEQREETVGLLLCRARMRGRVQGGPRFTWAMTNAGKRPLGPWSMLWMRQATVAEYM